MDVQQDDVQLVALLNRGDDLRGHHQIRAITNHHVHFAGRIGHLYPETPGDFVAHAGIAVLQVIAFDVPRAPELVQITGQTPGRANHHVLWPREFVYHADDFALTDGRTVAKSENALDLSFPILFQAGDATGVILAYLMTLECFGQLFKRGACIGEEWQRRVFVSIDCRYVDVYETHIRVLKRGFGSGGEVAQARSDCNHQIRLSGDEVRAGCSGDADRVEVLRVIERKRTFARLGLANRNARSLDELRQSRGCLAIDHPAAGNNQRFLSDADGLRRSLKQRAIGPRTRDVPDTL